MRLSRHNTSVKRSAKAPPLTSLLEGFTTMCPEDYDKMMQVVNKLAIATEYSREHILHLMRTISNNFGVMVPVITKSHRKLEEEIKLMFPKHDMETTYETPKKKRAREKKEYREYVNRIHKGKKRHSGRAF